MINPVKKVLNKIGERKYKKIIQNKSNSISKEIMDEFVRLHRDTRMSLKYGYECDYLEDNCSRYDKLFAKMVIYIPLLTENQYGIDKYTIFRICKSISCIYSACVCEKKEEYINSLEEIINVIEENIFKDITPKEIIESRKQCKTICTVDSNIQDILSSKVIEGYNVYLKDFILLGEIYTINQIKDIYVNKHGITMTNNDKCYRKIIDTLSSVYPDENITYIDPHEALDYSSNECDNFVKNNLKDNFMNAIDISFSKMVSYCNKVTVIDKNHGNILNDIILYNLMDIHNKYKDEKIVHMTKELDKIKDAF